MNEKTELSDERIKELAEQQGCWGASYGYSKESDFEKPVVPKHAYTFARAIEAELRAASPSSKSAKELSDEQIDAMAAKCWRESRYSGRDGQDFDHQAFARAVLASSSIKEDGERAEPKYRTVKIEDCELIEFDGDQPDGEFYLVPVSSSPPSPLGDTPRIPPGWKIERRDSKPFKVLNITVPNGYSSSVGSHERNPMNVLYMLAEALLEGTLGDTPEQQEQKK